MSARRGTLAWKRELDRLPRRLEDLLQGSFLLVYPCEAEPEEERRPLAA